jgi:predicted nucleic acid-binding Zn ribbon protein
LKNGAALRPRASLLVTASRKFQRLYPLARRPLIKSRRSRCMNPSLRAAVLAEWRGLPDRKMRPERWQSPAELMPKLMQRLGLRERLRETEVIYAWSRIVGDFIAAHSTPVALREGVLYVRVLQPALHYELEQISKTEILRKLKQRFGSKTIRDVRFRVG